MAEEETKRNEMRRVWNNKRRSSLYNLQDSVGLRYRKVAGVHGTKRQMMVRSSNYRRSKEDDNDIQLEQSAAAGNASFGQNEKKEPGSEITVESSVSPNNKKTSYEGMEEEESCVTEAADSSENEEELKKQAMANSECDHLFKQLREEFVQTPNKEDQDEIDTRLTGLHEEVKASGLFRRAMEEPEVVPHPLEESTQQAITRLQQHIQKCDQEMHGWKTLLDRKKKELQTGESALLPEIDDGFLKQHLTDEHQKLLQETTGRDSFSLFLERVEQQVDEIEKSLDVEIQAVITEKKDLEDKLNIEQRRCMAFLHPMETPRALVRDMKQCIPADSDPS